MPPFSPINELGDVVIVRVSRQRVQRKDASVVHLVGPKALATGRGSGKECLRQTIASMLVRVTSRVSRQRELLKDCSQLVVVRIIGLEVSCARTGDGKDRFVNR